MAALAMTWRFKKKFVRPVSGRVLIAGSKVHPGRDDDRAEFDDVVGVDMEDGEGVDIVRDLETPLPASAGTFSHIVCGSVLEHSRRPWLLAANLQGVLEPGGSIYVDAPTVWRFHGYPNDYWRFTHAGIEALFPLIDWREMRYCDAKGRMRRPPRIPHEGGLYSRMQIAAFGYRK